MTPRSSSPAIRQAGVLRRARWSAELQGVGSFSPAESWQTTVNPSVDGEPTAPPRHPDEAVPPHQGREREGEELLGLWGGVNRQDPARFVGNPSPTPNEAGPRQSFIGERLRPDDMRRFSSISEGVFRARLASMSCREESGRAQRDMQLLLRLVLRNRQVLGTSRTVAQVM